jgi:N-acetyl-anhydromuramyl-L-alanine amidase AmpD
MNIPFIQAKHYTKGRMDVTNPPNVIVLHTMEAPEQPTTAEAVARWFASDSAPMASAHYCVDDCSIYQCVLEGDTAWHAKGGNMNKRSIGIELAGYAKQTAEEWHDLYSEKMLDRAAGLVADLCSRYGIPAKFLVGDDIIKGLPGITTHLEITKAYKVPGGHTDPGPHFPMAEFLTKVESYLVYPAD